MLGKWPFIFVFLFFLFFDSYLDNYRDVKDIQEEVLREKLKSVDISKPTSQPQYPNVDLVRQVPSWMRVKIQMMRLGKYQWKDLYKD